MASCLSGKEGTTGAPLPLHPQVCPGPGPRVGLTGIVGQRAALISGSRTQVHPRYKQGQSPLVLPGKPVPFGLVSAGTSESLERPLST